MKRLLVLASTIFFLFLSSTSVDAANEYACQYIETLGPLGQKLCTNSGAPNNCQPGYKPGDCSRRSGQPANICIAAKPCIVSTPCKSKSALHTNCTTDREFTGMTEDCGQTCCESLESCPKCEAYRNDIISSCGKAAFSRYPKDCGQTKECCVDDFACINSTIINNPGILAAGNIIVACTADGHSGVNSALGCIPTDSLEAFGGWLFSWALYIIGAIAFLLLSYAAYQIITSSGDSKKMQAGQELITAVLSGLLFVILSMFLLRLIGFDILRLPQFIK